MPLVGYLPGSPARVYSVVPLRQVMGVAAMRPAAFLLAEALDRMHWREKDLLMTELDEPHDGWLRYVVETDHVYKEACVEAMQVQRHSHRTFLYCCPTAAGELTMQI